VTREHTPKPGVTWETRLARTELAVDDTAGPDTNQPPRPNRATRRALARAARRTK
jgi:hypothetical protein